ncbi:hypothetical protein H7J93_28205 [Mycobacterium barrassiae]|uniref:hypothetical protein n=1 Tax=Mycobacterium barrassiae TaxID=319709 RepID=UPI002265EF8A|nr:hypothetical protein [Mycobacterium barrassiae]MCV7303507.1 hypothetical protein [Mycobacterium barrassiae]
MKLILVLIAVAVVLLFLTAVAIAWIVDAVRTSIQQRAVAQEEPRKLEDLQRRHAPVVPVKGPGTPSTAKPPARTARAATRTNGTKPQGAQATSPQKLANPAKQRRPKQIGFATLPPTHGFELVCACPHCGAYDTHDLRAPVRPAPPEPAVGKAIRTDDKSWWDSVVGWFADADSDAADRPGQTEGLKTSDTSWWDVSSWFKSEPQDSAGGAADTEPAIDHPEAGVVRICRSCEHVWAQNEPA